MIFGCVAKWGYPHMREHDDKLINHWIQGYLATFSGCRDMVAMNTVVMMRTAQRLEMSYVLVVPNRLRQYGSRRMYCFGTAVHFETTIELCHSHQVKPLGNSFQISFTVILSNKVFQSIWNLIVFLFVIHIYIYIYLSIYDIYIYYSVFFHHFPSIFSILRGQDHGHGGHGGHGDHGGHGGYAAGDGHGTAHATAHGEGHGHGGGARWVTGRWLVEKPPFSWGNHGKPQPLIIVIAMESGPVAQWPI